MNVVKDTQTPQDVNRIASATQALIFWAYCWHLIGLRTAQRLIDLLKLQEA